MKRRRGILRGVLAESEGVYHDIYVLRARSVSSCTPKYTASTLTSPVARICRNLRPRSVDGVIGYSLATSIRQRWEEHPQHPPLGVSPRTGRGNT